MAPASGPSNPHWLKLRMGRGASKPLTRTPSWRRCSATWHKHTDGSAVVVGRPGSMQQAAGPAGRQRVAAGSTACAWAPAACASAHLCVALRRHLGRHLIKVFVERLICDAVVLQRRQRLDVASLGSCGKGQGTRRKGVCEPGDCRLAGVRWKESRPGCAGPGVHTLARPTCALPLHTHLHHPSRSPRPRCRLQRRRPPLLHTRRRRCRTLRHARLRLPLPPPQPRSWS